MATYYVGTGGNDGNSGLTWALRKLTLNGAEDVPVVANDTVYVGPGAYRELLTCDVSGNAGNPISYIGDVTGEHTDGIGGIVRITGSDNDQTTARANCVTLGGHDYRTFRGFLMDTASSALVTFGAGAVTNLTIEDCAFQNVENEIYLINEIHTDATIRRCVFWVANSTKAAIWFEEDAVQTGSDHLVENCTFLGGYYGVVVQRVADITIKNCTFIGNTYGVRVATALDTGDSIDVNNSILSGCSTALRATVATELVEDYNTLYANTTDRSTVNVGANSETYPPLYQPPVLLDGYRLPWWFGMLNKWSEVRAIAGTSEASDDLLGITRPTTSAKNSWGSLQFQPIEQDTGTVHAGSISLKFTDAGESQFKVAVDNVETDISVYVYREANYAGTNPRMLILEPGQAVRTTTDVAAASQWNQLTDTFTPQSETRFVIVALQSLNTAVAGNYDTFFDDLVVD